MLRKLILNSFYIILVYLIFCILIFKLNRLSYNDIVTVNNTHISNGNIVKEYNANNKNNDDDLIGKISIPKINMEKNLYGINSEKNNIEKNVTILKGSIFPGNGNSIIFLAAHSGTGSKAYFDDIKLLEKNDIVYLTYKDTIYTYIIINKKEVDKNGYISGIRTNSNEIVLTTCSDKKDKQLIINGILKSD